MKDRMIKFFVTGGYVGCIPFMPGTFGSMVAFPILWGVMMIVVQYGQNWPWLFSFWEYLGLNLSRIEAEILSLLLCEVLVMVVLFIAGIFYTNLYLKTTSHEDPKEVVIDEIVGQMLTNILSFLAYIFASEGTLRFTMSEKNIKILFIVIIPFAFFRFCDIVKPWPIDWIDENVKGGMGVMLDDVAAAILATLFVYAFTFLLLS